MKSRMLGGLLLLAAIVLGVFLVGCETTDHSDHTIGSSGSHASHGSPSGAGGCH